MNIYHSSDYAGISTDNFSAYYGYEVTDENDNWCFQAVFGKNKIKIPSTDLQVKDSFNVIECLLAGIGVLFSGYHLISNSK